MDKSTNTGSAYEVLNLNITKITSKLDSSVNIDTAAKRFVGFHLYKLTNDIVISTSEIAEERERLEYGDILINLPKFLADDVLADQRRSTRSLRSEVWQTDMFNSGLKKIIQEFDSSPPQIRVAKDVLDRVSEMIFHIACSISSRVANLARTEGTEEIDFVDVRKAMDELFPKLLHQHAVDLGCKNVEDHIKGIFKYRRRAPKAAKPILERARTKKAAPESEESSILRSRPEGRQKVKPKAVSKTFSIPADMFDSGLRKLKREFDSSPSKIRVDKEFWDRVSKVLFPLTFSVSSTVANLARAKGTEEIDFIDVRKAMDELFPKRLHQHALELGYKNTEDYLKGIFKYTRRATKAIKKRTPTKKAVPVRKTTIGKKRKRSSPRRRKVSPVKTKRMKPSAESSKRKASPRKSQKRTRLLRKDEDSKGTKEKGKAEPLPKKMPIFNDVTSDILNKTIKGIEGTVTMRREVTDKINSSLSNICESLVDEMTKAGNNVSLQRIHATINKFFPSDIAKRALGAAAAKVSVFNKKSPDLSEDAPLKDKVTRQGKEKIPADIQDETSEISDSTGTPDTSQKSQEKSDRTEETEKVPEEKSDETEPYSAESEEVPEKKTSVELDETVPYSEENEKMLQEETGKESVETVPYSEEIEEMPEEGTDENQDEESKPGSEDTANE